MPLSPPGSVSWSGSSCARNRARRQNSQPSPSRSRRSPSMWKFIERCAVIAVLLLSTGAVVDLYLKAPDLSGDGDARVQALWLVVYVALLVAFVVRSRKFAAVIGRNKVLLALLILALVSTSWSVAPTVTLRRGIALVGSTMFGIYLAARYKLSE